MPASRHPSAMLQTRLQRCGPLELTSLIQGLQRHATIVADLCLISSRVAHNMFDHDAKSWRRAVAVERVVCLCCPKYFASSTEMQPHSRAEHALRTPVLGLMPFAHLSDNTRPTCREQVLSGSLSLLTCNWSTGRCGNLPGRLAARTFRANRRRELDGKRLGGNVAVVTLDQCLRNLLSSALTWL